MMTKTSEVPRTRPRPLHLLSCLLRALSRPLWAPAADEKRFLFGLPATLILILLLWKRGLPAPFDPYTIPANFAFWSIAYTARYRERLRTRGELHRVILGSAVFLGLLLGLAFY